MYWDLEGLVCVLGHHGCRKGFRSGGAIARSRGLEAVVHT